MSDESSTQNHVLAGDEMYHKQIAHSCNMYARGCQNLHLVITFFISQHFFGKSQPCLGLPHVSYDPARLVTREKNMTSKYIFSTLQTPKIWASIINKPDAKSMQQSGLHIKPRTTNSTNGSCLEGHRNSGSPCSSLSCVFV